MLAMCVAGMISTLSAQDYADSLGVQKYRITKQDELTPKLSLVFDSFFLVNQQGGPLSAGFIIPGLRWNQSENRAFQIGFAGIINDGQAAPIPLPMLQWFRRL